MRPSTPAACRSSCRAGSTPSCRSRWYEDLFRHLKATYPIKLHALSPEEILYLCRLESLPLETVLQRLVAAGLDSLPGGGAEILVDRVRARIAKLKCTSAQWLEVMRVGHRLGLRSSSTMMFACGETLPERAEHLLKLRDLQDETGGFTAFICWPFQPGNTRLPGGDGSAHAYLRTLATARLALDNIPHLQASWPTMGAAVGQAALHFGADDFGAGHVRGERRLGGGHHLQDGRRRHRAARARRRLHAGAARHALRRG